MQIRCTQADHRNQQIIGVCIDITCQNQRPYCNFCLPFHAKHLQMLTSLDLFNEWIQQRIFRVKNAYNSVQDLKISLDRLITQFYPYFNCNVNQIPEFGLSEIDKLIKGLCQIEDCEKVLFVQLKQSTEQAIQIINEILKKMKYSQNIKENTNNQISQSIDQSILEQPKPLCKLKTIKFDLMNQNSIKQGDKCRAVAFNKDCSIVAAGCNCLIKIFEFKQGISKQVQLLDQHKNRVTTINFMKKTNQFISGDFEGSILIWANHDNQWICSQTAKQHNDLINCLIMNNNEDIMISSSEDKTIKFWTKKDQWMCQQTITDHKHWVFQLSLNEKQNQVISCGWDKLILVIEYSEQYKRWVVLQNIKIDCEGVRLCFINDNLFTFQPYQGNQMHIYEMNKERNQFIKTKNITVNQGEDAFGFFQQQYIKSKQLLVSKHQNFNLIRKQENDEFLVEQSIQLGSKDFYGQMSDDGEYLITWDASSKEIQIRRCIEG
ncbi:unnamed protein product [Paramecium octaurelia]|uniref:Uncharacterized protein n=1 Tax=Paramecium octaurelia TaxID=43137 RepID=A0A8S1UQM0_PAROT|nr:unnamed protein product [Paramecium octaurelia]